VHPRAIWRVFKGRGEILQYQLIQHARDRYVLRLAAADTKTYQRVIDGIVADLRHILEANAIMQAEDYQELERQGFGRFRPVISLCSQDSSV
jgi:hypothetical protein